MSLFFDEIDAIIAGSGILAESASISSENSLSPLYVLGNKGIINQSPSGPLRSSFSFNYVLESNYDPVQNIVSYLKTGRETTNYESTIVSLGGITGNCFLDSYSLKSSPNDVTKANVSFISFLPLTGFLQDKKGNINYNSSNTSGISHGWTTYFSNINNKIYEMDYSFKPNWEPVYTLGSVFPRQIQFLGAQEDMSFVKDIYTGIQFSGQNATGYFNFTGLQTTVKLFGLMNSNSYTIEISGSKVKNTQVNASLDDIVRVSSSVSKYY